MIIRDLGSALYGDVFAAMKAFTAQRTSNSEDEIWLVQHPAVYTVGRSADGSNSVSDLNGIPVVRVDRGGSITLHAPGQLVAYPLIDLHRAHILPRDYVHRLEQAVILTLADFGIRADTVPQAPGVYVARQGGDGLFVGKAKIASVGVKISHGCTYHGLSLNVAMDLSLFERISPCGYSRLSMTDMAQQGCRTTPEKVAPLLCRHLTDQLQS